LVASGKFASGKRKIPLPNELFFATCHLQLATRGKVHLKCMDSFSDNKTAKKRAATTRLMRITMSPKLKATATE